MDSLRFKFNLFLPIKAIFIVFFYFVRHLKLANFDYESKPYFFSELKSYLKQKCINIMSKISWFTFNILI